MNRTELDVAAGGTQQKLIVTTVPAAATPTQREAWVGALLQGLNLSVAGVYTCVVDITGLRRAEIHLRLSALAGGSVTPTVFTTFFDGITSKTVAAPNFAALAAGVRQTAVFADGTLLGENLLVVQITVVAPGGTFDQAEINGI